MAVDWGSVPAWVTAVGILAGFGALWAGKLQRTRQFESLFVQRYWAIMDKLSLDVLRGDPNGRLTDDDEKWVRAYFRLCEDELELQKKWISGKAWKIWSAGIHAQMRRWPFNEVWGRVKKESDAYPSGQDMPFVLLRKHLDDGSEGRR